MRDSKFIFAYYNIEDVTIKIVANKILFFVGNKKIIRLLLSNTNSLYYISANAISNYAYEEEQLVLHPQFFYQKLFT